MQNQTSVATLEKIFGEIEIQAKKDGVQVELSGAMSDSFSASYALGKLNKYSASTSHSAAMRVISGNGVGVATTESFDAESLKHCYADAKQSAIDLAKGADPTKPVDEILPPMQAPELVGLSVDNSADIQVSQKLKWAEELEAEALAASPKIKSVPYSGYHDSVSQIFLFNSRGQRLNYSSGGASIYSYAIGAEGENKVNSARGVFYRNAKDINAKAVAREAAEKTLKLLSAVRPKTGNYSVVFENEAAADLIGAMLNHFSAKAVAEEDSLLKGKIGQKIFSDLISIVDDPLQVKLSSARPFDSEGVPSRKTNLVENGKLNTFLTNHKYANLFKLQNTGNASGGAGEMDISPSNIIVAKGSSSIEDLLKSSPQVVLITQFEGGMHSGYKDTTGDFSLPASGFLYENGLKKAAINQFVVSGNVFEVLKNIKAISNRHPDTNDSVVVPDLLVENISIAGE
jgi:PmbA protein